MRKGRPRQDTGQRGPGGVESLRLRRRRGSGKREEGGEREGGTEEGLQGAKLCPICSQKQIAES